MFALQVALLTFVYALLLTLFGAVLVCAERQSRLGVLIGGVGLLLSYPLFVVGVMWLRPSVVLLGFVLAIVGLWLRVARCERRRVVARLVSAARGALVIAAVAVLFWIPGVLGPEKGLFSESGGDFTIYIGAPVKIGDAPLWTPPQMLLALRGDSAALRADDTTEAARPPNPGWSMQSVAGLHWGTIYTGWFALQHVLFQVPPFDPEAQYLAIEAILWSLIVLAASRLAGAWSGRVHALIALVLVAASQGLVYIGYNHYFPELLASSFSTICFAIVLLPRSFGLSRLHLVLLVSLTSVCVGIAYYPLLAVLILLWPALIVRLGGMRMLSLRADWASLPRLERLTLLTLGTAFVASAAVLMLAQFDSIAALLDEAVLDQSASTRDVYWGAPRPYEATQFAAWLGAFGLHRLPPYYSTEPNRVGAVTVLIVGALCLLGSMVVSATREALKRRGSKRPEALLLAYREGQIKLDGEYTSVPLAFLAGFAPFVGLEAYVGRHYEYLQFKALAYATPAVLLLLVLPLPFIPHRLRWPSAVALLGRALLLVGFLYFRVESARDIARGQEGSATLDANLYALGQAINQSDANAFVLAFPPAPAYFSLWELGLRDNRGLEMKYYRYPKDQAGYISEASVDLLWIVRRDTPGAPPADAIRSGSLLAYRPLSDSRCRVEPGPFASGAASLRVSLLGGAPISIWTQEDSEFWVFNPGAVDELTLVLLKSEGSTANTGPIPLQVTYPIETDLQVQSTRDAETERLVSLPLDLLRNAAGGATPDLIALRVRPPYSGVFCGSAVDIS